MRADHSGELATLGRLATLGKMASFVGHEINNPLAIILESAGWLKDLLATEDLAANPNLREFAATVDTIALHAGRARDITHRLLGFARHREPHMAPVEVGPLLEQTMGFLANEARLRRIGLQWPGSDLRVQADAALLQQVVLNLLDNALDAVDHGGTIGVAVTPLAGGLVEIAVSDSGPGIAPEVLARLFEPFFTTKPAGQGTGLGLALSRDIVHQLGGTLDVESEAGRGATFRIRLPAG